MDVTNNLLPSSALPRPEPSSTSMQVVAEACAPCNRCDSCSACSPHRWCRGTHILEVVPGRVRAADVTQGSSGGPVAPEPLHQLLWLLGRARILSLLLFLQVSLTTQSLPGWAWALALMATLALASDTFSGSSPIGRLHGNPATQSAILASTRPQKPSHTQARPPLPMVCHSSALSNAKAVQDGGQSLLTLAGEASAVVCGVHLSLPLLAPRAAL